MGDGSWEQGNAKISRQVCCCHFDATETIPVWIVDKTGEAFDENGRMRLLSATAVNPAVGATVCVGLTVWLVIIIGIAATIAAVFAQLPFDPSHKFTH